MSSDLRIVIGWRVKNRDAESRAEAAAEAKAEAEAEEEAEAEAEEEAEAVSRVSHFWVG